MSKVTAGAVLAMLPLLLISFAVVSAQETVDFSLPPAKGLKFKLVQKATTDDKMTITVNDQEPQTRDQSTKSGTTYTQTILEVKEGKVVKLEREYEDSSRTITMTGGRETEPRESENPLAWKHVRATWTDDECKIEIKEDDEWKEPEDGMKRRLRPIQLRFPLIPLPREPKKVGDEWELDEKIVKKYFVPTPRGGRRGEAEENSDPECEVTFKFSEVTDHREMKCAVLKMRLKMSRGDDFTQKIEATCHYSLKHRIVVGMKVAGTVEGSTTRERGESSIEMERSGTVKGETKVEIVEAGAAAEE